MGDFSVQAQNHNHVVVSTLSFASVGGVLLTVGTSTGSAVYIASNRALFYPLSIYAPITVATMFWLNGTAVSGNIDVGIYDEFGNRIVSSGSTAQAGTSVSQAANITDTLLQPGIYYMAMAMDNTTGTINRVPTPAITLGGAGCYQMATAFPLPSTATFAVMASAYMPIMAVSTRTFI